MQQIFLHGEPTTLQAEDYAFVLCRNSGLCEFGFFRQTGPETFTCLSFHPEFSIEARYEIPQRLITIFLRTVSAVTGLRHERIEDLTVPELGLLPFYSSQTNYYRFVA